MIVVWMRVYFVVYGRSDVLKFSKLHKPKASAIWKPQNITSDHKSKNARASSWDFLLYSQQSYFGIKYLQHFIELFVLIFFNFLFDLQFCHTFNQVCFAFKVFWFLDFLLVAQDCFVWNRNRTVNHFGYVFKIGTCGCFHSNFLIASIT